MPRTVVHVMGSLNRGGAESVALDLVRGVGRDEFRQVFFCFSGAAGVLAPEFRALGAEVVTAQGNAFQRFVAFVRLLRSQHCDVVQSHVSLTSGWFLLLARLSGVPVRVARIHSEGDGHADTRARVIYRWLCRWALHRSSTHVLAVSQAALDFATDCRTDEWSRGSRVVEVVPNGVDIARFSPATHPRDVDAVPTVLHVGRADPAKNRKALGPMARAVNERRHVRFRVVGTDDTADLGPDREFLDVEGPRTDIEQVYRECDVLVLPSIREGLPGVVLEALASGVPVVASDLVGLRQLADALPGIRLVSAEAAPDVWASAVLEALAQPEVRGDQLAASIAASQFALVRNIDEWRKVWGA